MIFWPSHVFMGMKYDISSTISSACGDHLNEPPIPIDPISDLFKVVPSKE